MTNAGDNTLQKQAKNAEEGLHYDPAILKRKVQFLHQKVPVLKGKFANLLFDFL